MTHAPRSRRRAGVHRPRLRVPRAQPRRRPGGCVTSREAELGRHVPGPLRARRLRRGARQPADRSSTSATPPWCFGRIDRDAESHGRRRRRRFHIGRLAVADEQREPVVVDWRAPVAEPFYRATGRDPMGLARRRHFAVEGRQLLGIEDELFGERPPRRRPRRRAATTTGAGAPRLLHAARRARARPHRPLGDIVATIQAEQDEIIRSPQAGVLVVQGGPGTGKTVVALHRAAYLLYTHRFPLEDQGVLVVGPNRVFLRYIEQVLPSLGEAGVELVVLADLVARRRRRRRRRPRLAARVKGDVRMADVIARPCATASGRCARTCVVPFRPAYLRLTRRRTRRASCAPPAAASAATTPAAGSSRARCSRRWPRPARDRVDAGDEVRERAPPPRPRCARRSSGCGRCSRRPQLLHDLFGSQGPAATWPAAGVLDDDESTSLHRPRADDVDDVRWTDDDVALLDEARELLGPRPGRGGKVDDGDEIRTYGHIVVDEVQDLSPMQLRMVARRSLNGSMTVVGDIAQATGRAGARRLGRGARAPARPPAGPRRRAHASATASRPRSWRWPTGCCGVAAPELAPPDVGARGRRPARGRRVPTPTSSAPAVAEAVARAAGRARRRQRRGRRARRRWSTRSSAALDRRRHRARRGHPHAASTSRRHASCRSSVVKGLELDGVVRGRAGPHRRRGAPGPAGALRRPHPRHQAPHHRPRAAPARSPGRSGRQPRRCSVNLTLALWLWCVTAVASTTGSSAPPRWRPVATSRPPRPSAAPGWTAGAASTPSRRWWRPCT